MIAKVVAVTPPPKVTPAPLSAIVTAPAVPLPRAPRVTRPPASVIVRPPERFAMVPMVMATVEFEPKTRLLPALVTSPSVNWPAAVPPYPPAALIVAPPVKVTAPKVSP